MGRQGILEEFKIVLHEKDLLTRVPALAPEEGVVVIETGTRAAWIKRVLGGAGMRVIVADARKLRAISTQPVKTDRNDARMLARLGLAELLLGGHSDGTAKLLCDTYVRPPEHQRIYEQLKMRDLMVRRRGDFIRLVRSIVKGTGATLRSVEPERFPLLVDMMPAELVPMLQPMLDAIRSITESIAAVDVVLETAARQIPDVVRLDSIHGVGPITALAYYVVIGNPYRFSSNRDVGAYLGMVVRRDQSGRQDPALGITKTGNGFLRRMLVQCATYIIGPRGQDSDLRRWGLAYIEGHGKAAKKKARIGVARRLAVMMNHLWKSGEAWRPIAATAEKAHPTPEHVGSDDCDATPVPARSAGSETVVREIAASPTDQTQPCPRPMTATANESGERRGGGAARPDGRRKSRSPVQGSPASAPGRRAAIGPADLDRRAAGPDGGPLRSEAPAEPADPRGVSTGPGAGRAGAQPPASKAPNGARPARRRPPKGSA
jgi:transposase